MSSPLAWYNHSFLYQLCDQRSGFLIPVCCNVEKCFFIQVFSFACYNMFVQFILQRILNVEYEAVVSWPAVQPGGCPEVLRHLSLLLQQPR